MSTTTMTGINTVQHIVQNLNTPVRADEGNEDNLIDPQAVVALREIETRMVRQVYRERSVSLVAGSIFPSAKSEAGSGNREWNETNPDSPLNISSLFPSNKSETDSSPEFSRSNSDSIMSIFLPATSPIDSPENYEITLRSCSVPAYSIMSIFSPARSEINSPDNYEIIVRNRSIPSYYHFFPPYMSDTDSHGSSTPNQLSIPSLYFPPNKSETINSSLGSNGISLDERILGRIEKFSIEVQKMKWDSLDEKIKKCIHAVKILRSNSVYDLMYRCTDKFDQIRFNKALLNFREAVALGRSPDNLFRILDPYDEMAETVAMKPLDNILETEINQAIAMLTGRNKLIDLEYTKQSMKLRRQNAMLEILIKGAYIHPLTQTMMNCVKLILVYSEIGEDGDRLDALRNHDSNTLTMNLLALQLLVLINFLESNLEEKSKLFEDGALQYIFLMNNMWYVERKVEVLDLCGLLGDNWVQKQRGQIRQYATSYLRASWTKVLHCLKDEGIGGSSSNASRVALKERFKNFNACFEEIYRVQTAWKVPDTELRKELRISISENVIPAYRSFMGRFGNQVEIGKDAGKYIKYTADDLERFLFNLFKGEPQVLHRWSRKSK